MTNRNAVLPATRTAPGTPPAYDRTPALTTRGFGAAEFDAVAELIVECCENTTPAAASSGKPGKAKYIWPRASRRPPRRRLAELLAANPLYPGLLYRHCAEGPRMEPTTLTTI